MTAVGREDPRYGDGLQRESRDLPEGSGGLRGGAAHDILKGKKATRRAPGGNSF